jgi:YD repeat-containing protein
MTGICLGVFDLGNVSGQPERAGADMEVLADQGQVATGQVTSGLGAPTPTSTTPRLGGYGLSLSAMAGCMLCGALLAPVITRSQAATTASGRCFDYDAAGRLSGVRDEGGQLRSYGLDPASNRKGVSSGIGVVCSLAVVPAPLSGVAAPLSSSAAPAAGSSSPLTSGVANNTPPVAASDSLIVEKFDTESVLVLSNDFDADGDVLEVTAATYDSAKVQVTRVRSLTSGTRYVYLDIVGVAVGSSQVQYTVSDGRGGQATGTVNVAVTPQSVN